MSYDSDIRYYQNKIDKINRAKPNIRNAINDYKEALGELGKIIGVRKCEILKTNIGNKINELEALITKMNGEVDTYNGKIRELRRRKAAAEAAARRAEAARKAAEGK